MTGAPIHADGILRRLDELWRTLASPGVTELLRACAMTLLVLTEEQPGEAALAASLAELMLAHPFRAIVLGRISGDGRRLQADVTARCVLARGRRTQICCEQIQIGATAEALADLPPVVRGLLAADLPVVVWLRESDLLTQEPLAGLLSLADKLVLDSAAGGDWRATLGRARRLLARCAALADLAWTRLNPWRLALSEAFDDPEIRARIRAVEAIEVHHSSLAPPASAVYLAAWLRLRLPGQPAARFVAGSPGGDPRAVRLYSSSEVELECKAEHLCRFPGAARLEDLLAEELSLMGPDPAFEAVLDAVLA